MDRTIPDVQISVKKNNRRLYDGDFIDLTSENEFQQIANDEVVLLDDSPTNEGDLFDEVTNIQMDNETALKSVVNSINTDASTKDVYLVPVNSSNQFAGQYLVLNKSSTQTVSLQNTSNESQNVKSLDQPTDNGLITLENTQDNVITKRTPVVQNKKSQKVIIHDHVKISPNKEETVSGIRKDDTKGITAGALIPVMESNVIENILKKMGPKRSKPVGGIVRLSSKTTTKSENTLLNNVKTTAAGNKFRSLNRTSITQNSLQNCQNSKSPQVFETQDVIVKPSRSEVNWQKNAVEKSVKNKNCNPSLVTQSQILQTNLRTSDNKIKADDNTILVPSQSEHRLVEKTVMSTKPSTVQSNTVKTFSQTSSGLVQSVEMTYSSNKINNFINSENEKTNNNQPLTSVVLPEFKILCDGKQLDISSKTVLVHTTKEGKKGYIILNNKHNVVNVPVTDKHKPVPNILKRSQNKQQPALKSIKIKEIRKPPVQPNVHPTVTDKDMIKRKDSASTFLNKQDQKKFEESKEPVSTVDNSFLKQSVTESKKGDVFSTSLQNRWARMNINIKNANRLDATSNNNIFKEAGTSSMVDSAVSCYYDVFSEDSGDATVLQNVNNSKETEETNFSSEDNDLEIIEPDERDPLDGTVLIEDTKTVQPCVVTPVDITKILNKAKKPKLKPKDRCDAITLKKQTLYHRGFTKREMATPICQNYLAIAIHTEQEKIKELKKRIRSYETKTNFVHCQSDPNKFLPENFQCEPDDGVTMEYSNIEDIIYNSTTLPVISQVISEVNDKVVNIKKTQQAKSKRSNVEEDLQEKLAKPEAALRLIKKGLELIQSWSKETHTPKEKVKKTLPLRGIKKDTTVEEGRRRKRTPVVTEEVKEVVEKKRRVKSVDKKEFLYQPIKKGERKIRSQQIEKPSTVVQETQKVIKKRGRNPRRKRRTADLGNSDDNELLIIKKVDILNDKKKVR